MARHPVLQAHARLANPPNSLECNGEPKVLRSVSVNHTLVIKLMTFKLTFIMEPFLHERLITAGC
jgi:hypothetical protein